MTVTNEVGPAETPSGSPSREQSSGLFERVRALFGLAPASARDDIEDAIEESASEEFTPQERAILKNVLALHDVRVMKARHDSPSNGKGQPGLDMPLSAAQILRPVLYAPPSMPALDLLLKMQASRTHMALVIDEYGGTDGLVSIEDVMESIVGDIEDEHDEDETHGLHQSADGAWIAEARAPLDAVSEAAGFDFSSLPEAEEVDTIGGLIIAAAGRVPNRGEILLGPGEFEYEVLDADPRRIKRVKIRPLAAQTKPLLSLPTPDPKPDEPPQRQSS